MSRGLSRIQNKEAITLVALLSALTLAFWISGTTSALLGLLCLLVCVLIGLGYKTLQSVLDRPKEPELLQLLIDLAADKKLASTFQAQAQSLLRISEQQDPLFRRLAESKLRTLSEDFRILGESTIDFCSTESWRVVYEELLKTPGLQTYRSVSYIQSPDYWQDGPGRMSTELNLELHDKQAISIERIAVIADNLWRPEELLPDDSITSWLGEQHAHGIYIKLLRESTLSEQDQDLRMLDMGIYGQKAVGELLADPASNTIRYTLYFAFEKIQLAEAKWQRLKAYGESFRSLLDRQH